MGKVGEDYAFEVIKKRGYEIIKRNYRKRNFEIDIIAVKYHKIAFFEVKTDSSAGLDIYEKIPRKKIFKMKCGANSWIMENPKFNDYEIILIGLHLRLINNCKFVIVNCVDVGV